MMPSQHVFTIGELNRSARELLESHLGEFWVKGEISDFKRAPSGHLYFTLRDEASEISAVRFRSRSALFDDRSLDVGTLVLAYGKLTIYEPRGRYQFVATLIQPVAAGALRLAFEQLKQKLQAEGLFSPDHKKPLPSFPERIGVITSPSGAALRDIASVLERRWHPVSVMLFPSAVQGSVAPADLCAAVDRAVRFSEKVAPLDLLILGRGGGSAEDLAAFNDEALARTVFSCPIPTISAVGHEIDFSIVDFVADHRAPTPSAAAELAVPSRLEIIAWLDDRSSQMVRAIHGSMRSRRQSLQSQLRSYLFGVPTRLVDTMQQRLDLQLGVLLRTTAATWNARHRSARHAAELLRLSDPHLPLQRGYSLTFLASSSQALRDTGEISVGDNIETRLGCGRLTSRIEEVHPE